MTAATSEADQQVNDLLTKPTEPVGYRIETLKVAALDGNRRFRKYDKDRQQEAVEDYIGALQSGADLPMPEVIRVRIVPAPSMTRESPATVDFLTDGGLTVIACKQIGREEIQCKVRDGTMDEVIKAAASANTKHGCKRSRKDTLAAMIALEALPSTKHLSNRELADVGGVSHTYVDRHFPDRRPKQEAGSEEPRASGNVAKDDTIEITDASTTPAPVVIGTMSLHGDQRLLDAKRLLRAMGAQEATFIPVDAPENSVAHFLFNPRDDQWDDAPLDAFVIQSDNGLAVDIRQRERVTVAAMLYPEAGFSSDSELVQVTMRPYWIEHCLNAHATFTTTSLKLGAECYFDTEDGRRWHFRSHRCTTSAGSGVRFSGHVACVAKPKPLGVKEMVKFYGDPVGMQEAIMTQRWGFEGSPYPCPPSVENPLCERPTE